MGINHSNEKQLTSRVSKLKALESSPALYKVVKGWKTGLFAGMANPILGFGEFVNDPRFQLLAFGGVGEHDESCLPRLTGEVTYGTTRWGDLPHFTFGPSLGVVVNGHCVIAKETVENSWENRTTDEVKMLVMRVDTPRDLLVAEQLIKRLK
jgi:hypothetical protein